MSFDASLRCPILRDSVPFFDQTQKIGLRRFATALASNDCFYRPVSGDGNLLLLLLESKFRGQNTCCRNHGPRQLFYFFFGPPEWRPGDADGRHWSPRKITHDTAYAPKTLFDLLVVNSITAIANYFELCLQVEKTCNSVGGYGLEPVFADDRLHLGVWQICQNCLAHCGAIHRVPPPNGRRHANGPRGFHLVQVKDLSIIKNSEVNGLTRLQDQLVEHGTRALPQIEMRNSPAS